MDQKNVPEKLLKPYDPKATEPEIYAAWEKSGYFNPDNLPGERTENFSVVLPPPNVTGILHLGHALEDSLQDAIVRYKRMRGFKTLWVPGTDHAAIATQSKVEKLIEKEEGKRRHDVGRDEFLVRVKKFAQDSHDTIVSQIRRMGASLDWSREAFTLDEERNLAVRTAFKKMYDDGLIYRGHRLVNWDPKGQTTISDDEIEYKEEKTTFYYLKYGPFIIGTARPETKFGDKYVVMHPDDSRYAQYKQGEKIDLEWINGPITATVIKDESIDMEFGTGVMTITPWHSAVDFEIAERHNLDKEQIIDEYGKLLPIAGEFAGMKITEARGKIVEKLRSKGLVEKEENYTHNIATAERTGGIIEPQIKLQWFVNVNKPIASRDNKSLKDLMREAVEKDGIQIMPDRFEKIYFHWINNLRDWCISRQIWYGHRIPVWYKDKELVVGDAPSSDGWIQDEDTLDTWFSSALWSFSTLGWPNQTQDLKLFHPNSLINPGYEILFFWIARMILMSKYLLNEVPFKVVYLHGILRDKQGRKFSKSLGNGIDVVEIVDKYGADALRMASIVGIGPGNDANFDEQKVKAYKLFANKLWNIARYVSENSAPLDKKPVSKNVEEFDALVKEITKEMDEYKFYLVAEKLYQYVWHTFADKIIEESKGKPEYGPTLRYILINSLKLLHPFMPFVTEELWNLVENTEKKTEKMLIISEWPTS